MRFCFLPSPLTTPAVGSRLAAELERRGHEAVVAGGGETDTTDLLARFVAAAEGADVVVPHSNAGRFGPAVASEVGAELVCLDALLPGGGEEGRWVDFLRAREQPDGLLAPWTRWWPEEDVLTVAGDHLELLRADEPRVSLRLLLQDPPAPTGWLEHRSGYLGFGDTYADQQALVAAHGWEVRRLDGTHLHLLTDPATVAEALLDVVGLLGRP
ncbi:hypothetical protein GCM10009623_20630 [Nocardioides aestuarii]|uniref:Alpha/beta hydrolase n=1 Tax=Nocardioides aestuarii TaxID=252231 RepID=A0ABW4TNU5_9ACTN